MERKLRVAELRADRPAASSRVCRDPMRRGMCGIVAELATGAPVARDRFERMVESLGARGPDGAGLRLLDGDRVALGHTRLAIIDLSEAGLQPLPNEDETAWLVFNGEIYNYRELRNELIGAGHRFRSQTDSEVVVHAYEEWGDDCVHRLRGMFAFAIWDSARRRLFAARDRLGVKPLYLWQHPGGLVIASQPRAILAHPAFRPEVNRAAFQNYLAYSYVPRDLSIYEGVSKVPAGHRVAVEGTSLRVDRYWEPHYRPEIRDPAEAAEMIRLKLAEAVETQLVSDVPIGFFLSGGIDSTSVAAIAASRCEEVPPSFTIGFDDAEGDERVHARLAAERIGCPAHERTLTVGDAFDLLPAYVRAYDEPFYDHSAIPTLAVSELARSHGVKVVLSGDGGDEVFGGYTWPGDETSRLYVCEMKSSTSSIADICRLTAPQLSIVTPPSRSIYKRRNQRPCWWTNSQLTSSQPSRATTRVANVATRSSIDCVWAISILKSVRQRKKRAGAHFRANTQITYDQKVTKGPGPFKLRGL